MPVTKSFSRPFAPKAPLAAAACLAVAAALGCDSGKLKIYPVAGAVKLPDGSPLAGGRVEFQLIDNPHMVTSRGYIASDGSFSLSTFEIGDGAPAGKHQVVVAPPVPKGDHDSNPRTRSIIDPKYLDYQTSGLEYEVGDDASLNRFEIVVERNKGR